MKALFVTSMMLIMATFGQAASRPNFLFLYTDDQRWDALSVVQKEQGNQGRFPWFRTPNMDRIAAEGVRFRNAFVTLSLCAPSRACFLTGRYNHLNGVASNFRPFPTNNVTHATLLRAAGYTTAYVGKWHMDSQRERPGFDYHASFIGHARYVDPPFIVNGKDVATKGWIDDISTDYAIDFIRRQKDSPKPWSLVLGFKSPHGPFEPPGRWADKFPEGYARGVPNLGNTPPFPGPINHNAVVPNPSGPDAHLKVNLNYFRCIAAVDENVGRLLAALDDLGFASNTVVIYTSDNGFYLGEHRLADKRSAYDESMRIPLLVRYPPLQSRGRVLDQMALNIDLAPTLLDFAGVAIPAEMQGKSWRPLLEGASTTWRQSFFYEYFWEQQRGNPTPTHTAVRTTSAKLVKFNGRDEWNEMFDLSSDPYETRNLINDPASAALRRTLEAEYSRLSAAVGYTVPSYAENPAQHQRAAALNAWILDYRFDRDQGDRVIDSSGRNNHGSLRGTRTAAAADGNIGVRFDGKNVIDVPKSSSLNPAVASWSVEVSVRAGKSDGVILAQGGEANGYCLSIEDGHPAFTVVGDHERTHVISPRTIGADWTIIKASWRDGQVSLDVAGEVTRTALQNVIPNQPHEGLQIGADLGTQVQGHATSHFVGEIMRVRIASGIPKGD